MPTTANIIESFEDLGISLEDPKAIDRLVALCDIFGVEESKLSCEYLAFASKKKMSATAPTLQIVEMFEKEMSKSMANSKASKSTLENVTSCNVYDSSNLPLSDTSMCNSDLDDSALNFYGTPRGKGGQSKRQLTPDNSAVNKRHAIAALASGNSPVPFSPTTYMSATPNAVGKKYSARADAGKTTIRYEGKLSGATGTTMPAQYWKTDGSFVASITPFDVTKTLTIKSYKYMFERLREKAGFLDETICRITDQLVAKHWKNETVAAEGENAEPIEPLDFCQVMPDPIPAAGRICCDASEGRLNAKSIVLQGSQDICRGLSLPLDASNVPEYSLFPGQIVTAKLTNPNGSKLVASKIWSDASPPLPDTRIRLNGPTECLDLVVASGPFTCSSDLEYEPLKDLLAYVANNQPQVLILCGPFVDDRHTLIVDGKLSESYDVIFGRIMKLISEAVENICTQVVIVSSHRDVHHHPVYPTPAFEESKNSSKLQMMSDPCMVNIEGVIFGITSTDIIFHLGKEEISFPPKSGDRIRRLVNHLVQQQSFYPLYPPNDEMSLDLEQLEAIGQMPVQPHVLVLPGNFNPFFQELNGCLVTNPSRLAKGEGGGVFCRIKIRGLKEDADPTFIHRVHAEIVRI